LRPGILDLSGAVGRRFPALVGPERGDEPDPEGPEQAEVERPGRRLDEVRRVPPALGEEEDGDDDESDRGRLDVGQQVLEPGAPADAHVVDGPEEGDEARRDELLLEPGHLDEPGQDVVGEGHGQGGRGAGIDDQEERPPEEERQERPVGLPEIDVNAAGFGHGGAELGEGQGPEEAEQPAHDPDRQHEEGRGQDRRDLRRRQEDPRADDPADDDHDDVPEAEDAGQADLGLVDGGRSLGVSIHRRSLLSCGRAGHSIKARRKGQSAAGP
jgi:hypothetical protein